MNIVLCSINSKQMKLHYFLNLLTIIMLPLYSTAQSGSNNYHKYDYFSNFEFNIESGISQLLIQGDYSLKLDSEVNSRLDYYELNNHSEHRNIKPAFFIGVGANYNFNNRFSLGVIYKMNIKQTLNETGSISSIKVIGPNTISTESSGNYLMISELSNSIIMASATSNFLITKRNRVKLNLSYGMSFGYSNIKAVTHVPNAKFNLRMYSESFQPEIKSIGSIVEEEIKKGDYCWSVFSNIILKIINAPNISIGYAFTRLGKITLIKKRPKSSNLIQSSLFNNEENSNTIETLSLVTTNSKLKLFSHNFSVSIIF